MNIHEGWNNFFSRCINMTSCCKPTPCLHRSDRQPFDASDYLVGEEIIKMCSTRIFRHIGDALDWETASVV